MEPISPLSQFLFLSSALTGFSIVDLQATGVTNEYLTLVTNMVGERLSFDLWSETRKIAGDLPVVNSKVEREINRRILRHALFGPIARNILLLWYNAVWYALPGEWTDKYGANALDQDHVVSAAAYPTALVWPAMGAHPPAAKPTGFASWAMPPDHLRKPTDESA